LSKTHALAKKTKGHALQAKGPLVEQIKRVEQELVR
jgi:hypothetical protein